MRIGKYYQLARDVGVSLLAAALWLLGSQIVGSSTGPSVLLLASLGGVFFGSLIFLRATRGQRRLRRLMAHFISEPSASKTGDLAIDLLGQLAAMKQLDQDYMADLAQRRRHPTSRILDGIDVVLNRNEGRSNQLTDRAVHRYLTAVRAAKSRTRERAVRQAVQHLQAILNQRCMLLVYGYSTVVCDAIRTLAPSVPIFVVRDMQYGLRSSLGEHAIVQQRLAESDIEVSLIDTDQITGLLDPQSYRLRTLEGASIPLPDTREVIAVIGCEAADRSGRVLIPATVRSQPSETAWFVAEFARARQRGQGASISAQLVVVGESFKVFGDLASRPELRSTSAPVAVSTPRLLAHTFMAIELPRGVPVELVEIGPDHIDMYVDDAVAVRTKRGLLQLDASYVAWNQQVGIVQAPVGTTPRDLRSLLGECELIFLDFNGVLVDDEVDHYCAFAALSRSTVDRSLPIDIYLAACAGRTDAEGIGELVKLGFASGQPEKLLADKQTFYQRHAVPVGDQYRERLHRLLSQLGAVAPLVLVTASDREAVVAALGDERILDDHFAQDSALFEIESAERVAAIGRIVRRHGVKENRQCLVVDDSERNLSELRRRGYSTLGVSGLISDRSMPADIVVKDLTELSELLETSYGA